MPSLTLVIHMTGLLLLTPDTRAGAFPLHVLMPTEGRSRVPTHMAQIGWVSTAAACPKNDSYDYDGGKCYFKLDGWAVELGRGGIASVLLPPAGPLDVTYLHKVNRSWFGPMPVAGMRSRVSIYSGHLRAEEACSFARWTIDNVTGRRLPNVVTWETALPGSILRLTATRRDEAGTTVSMNFKNFGPTGEVELFLRQEPITPPPEQRPPFVASHYVAIYGLLGYSGNDHLRIPRDGHPTAEGCRGKLQFFPNPGTPTCMPAVGIP